MAKVSTISKGDGNRIKQTDGPASRREFHLVLDGSAQQKFNQLTLIGGQTVASVVVRQHVDAQTLAQELAPRVNVAQILGVGVGVQEGDALAVVVLAGAVGGGILPGDVAFSYPRAVQVARTSGVGVNGPRLGVAGRFDVEGGYSRAPGGVEPYDFGLLELRGGRGLEEDRADGVSHGGNSYSQMDCRNARESLSK